MTDATPAAAEAPIVLANGLRKSFGRREILHGLDFAIPPGRIVGLVGHNGAGKTTTLNAILGLAPAQGTLSVLGLDPYRHRARLMRDVAFISDVASLPRFFYVGDLLKMVAAIHPRFSADAAARMLRDTDIRPAHKVGNLSKGMLAQLHLAIVMAIDARLLVLDEPTLGLDITFRKRFYQRLAEDYMNPGRSILITTHQVDEIEPLFTDVMFMRDGYLVLDAPMAGVATRFTQVVVTPGQEPAALAFKPIFDETHFGRRVMIFDGVGRTALAPLGELSTPTISDLFVALMQRPGEGRGAAA